MKYERQEITWVGGVFRTLMARKGEPGTLVSGNSLKGELVWTSGREWLRTGECGKWTRGKQIS